MSQQRAIARPCIIMCYVYLSKRQLAELILMSTANTHTTYTHCLSLAVAWALEFLSRLSSLPGCRLLLSQLVLGPRSETVQSGGQCAKEKKASVMPASRIYILSGTLSHPVAHARPLFLEWKVLWTKCVCKRGTFSHHSVILFLALSLSPCLSSLF